MVGSLSGLLTLGESTRAGIVGTTVDGLGSTNESPNTTCSLLVRSGGFLVRARGRGSEDRKGDTGVTSGSVGS